MYVYMRYCFSVRQSITLVHWWSAGRNYWFTSQHHSSTMRLWEVATFQCLCVVVWGYWRRPACVEWAVPLQSGLWWRVKKGWGQWVIFSGLGQGFEISLMLWHCWMADRRKGILPLKRPGPLILKGSLAQQVQSSMSMHHYRYVALCFVNIRQKGRFWAASLALAASCQMRTGHCRHFNAGGAWPPWQSSPVIWRLCKQNLIDVSQNKWRRKNMEEITGLLKRRCWWSWWCLSVCLSPKCSGLLSWIYDLL